MFKGNIRSEFVDFDEWFKDNADIVKSLWNESAEFTLIDEFESIDEYHEILSVQVGMAILADRVDFKETPIPVDDNDIDLLQKVSSLVLAFMTINDMINENLAEELDNGSFKLTPLGEAELRTETE